MAEFFFAGGWGMLPTLLFGFLSVAASVLFLLRPESRRVGLIMSLGGSTAASGLLGCGLGLMLTFRYLGQVPAADQLKVAALGCEESLHNVVLALILLVVTGSIASIGHFRMTRLGATATQS